MLWLLDRMVDTQVLAGSKAIAALQMMLKSGRRLPQLECERYIQVWQAAKKGEDLYQVEGRN